MMQRVPNWDIELHKWAQSIAALPYVWGQTDCGSIVREAHVVMYGVDPFNVDPYTSAQSALVVHCATGGVQIVLRSLGAIEVHIKRAQQGDILIESAEHGFPACGVVVGRDVIWATIEGGVVRTPLRGRVGLVLRVPHG